VSWAFLRREWGAVAFVITVLIGIIVVPAALILNQKSTATGNNAVLVAPSVTPSPTSSASPTPTTSPSASPSR
jgi:hypothetical protein